MKLKRSKKRLRKSLIKATINKEASTGRTATKIRSQMLQMIEEVI